MLPRLFELRDSVPDPTHPDAYFQHFEERLESEHVRELFMKVERSLQTLDAEAWHDLKERAIPNLTVRDGGRGWQKLFDTLNEAKGYAYLRRSGCTDIAFIEPAKNKKTPDLRASHDGTPLLCEVKTINVSKDEAERRERIARGDIFVTKVSNEVTAEMLQKVRATLEHGITQLDGEDPERRARRIVFTILTFDDWVGDYQTEDIAQLDAHLLAQPVTGAELVFCPASNLFERSFTMRSASIVEI